MNNLRNIYLLYTSMYSERPAMVFWSESDANAVCDALNKDKDEGDMFWCHIESMPMIGCEY